MATKQSSNGHVAEPAEAVETLEKPVLKKPLKKPAAKSPAKSPAKAPVDAPIDVPAMQIAAPEPLASEMPGEAPIAQEAPPPDSSRRLAMPIRAEQVAVENILTLAVIAQKDATVSQSNAAVMVAGEQLAMENGGGMLFAAGQDLKLTNGGAGVMVAGRDAQLTNGGAGVLFAVRDLTVGHVDDNVAMIGGKLTTEQRRSMLLVGHEAHVRNSTIGIVIASNATFDGDTRILIDLSPQRIINTVVGLVTAPLAWLSSWLPGSGSEAAR